jgi:CDP-paratose 2-epimerase
MKILITGGAGFIGSHAAEFYARNRHDVVVFDNLSRGSMMTGAANTIRYQWDYLGQYANVKLTLGDVRNFEQLIKAASDADVIIHCAGQTAVTTSIIDPRLDFEINALGTFNVLEAASKLKKKPTVIFCSTNKVYGKNINLISILKQTSRYSFSKQSKNGISEQFSVDSCEHSPYGCSKLTGDMYMQEYGLSRGLKVGIFRMSCIYGARQFGVEDQGWLAWFVIAALLGKPLVIYGDGRQVRDVLYVSDLVRIFDTFIKSPKKFGIFNTGGGLKNTLSLLELVSQLERRLSKKIKLSYEDWRPSDQKVYVSNITKAKKELGWAPQVSVEEGLTCLIDWTQENMKLFKLLHRSREGTAQKRSAKKRKRVEMTV